MATPSIRRLQPTEVRSFGSRRANHAIPDLTEIQTRFYDAFLQYGVPANKRKDHGIEGVLREIFPLVGQILSAGGVLAGQISSHADDLAKKSAGDAPESSNAAGAESLPA